MRLNCAVSLAAVAVAAVLSVRCQLGHAKQLDQPVETRHAHGHGDHASVPASHENGLAVVRGAAGDGGATTGDAVVELIMFVHARGWGIEVDVEGSASGEGHAKFVVGAGTSSARETCAPGPARETSHR